MGALNGCFILFFACENGDMILVHSLRPYGWSRLEKGTWQCIAIRNLFKELLKVHLITTKIIIIIIIDSMLNLPSMGSWEVL